MDPFRNHPHDALFRAGFGEPRRLAELLRSSLPPAIGQAVDWARLQPMPDSFVDHALRDLHSDLLFTVPVGARQTLLYVLCEHKGHRDPAVVLQLLRYLLQVWERAVARQPGVRRTWRLPPVLPFVLHHGQRRYAGPDHLRQAIDLAGLPRELHRLQPSWRLWIDDLAAQPTVELAARPASAGVRLLLLHLQLLRGRRAAELLPQWRPLFRELLADPAEDRLLGQLLHYVRAVATDPAADLHRAYAMIHPKAAKRFVSNLEQTWNEGHAEGHAEGLRTALTTVLRERFGPLPSPAAARVAAASAADLQRWLVNALSAPDLDAALR